MVAFSFRGATDPTACPIFGSTTSTASFAGIFPEQDGLCYVGNDCKVENLLVQYLEGDTHVKLLQGGCGSHGNEWSAAPNGGVMNTESASDSHITLLLPGTLPGRHCCHSSRQWRNAVQGDVRRNMNVFVEMFGSKHS